MPLGGLPYEPFVGVGGAVDENFLLTEHSDQPLKIGDSNIYDVIVEVPDHLRFAI